MKTIEAPKSQETAVAAIITGITNMGVMMRDLSARVSALEQALMDLTVPAGPEDDPANAGLEPRGNRAGSEPLLGGNDHTKAPA